MWLFRCDCGIEVEKLPADLKKQANPSAGPCGKERLAARRRTHGMSGHPAFAVWRSMLDRCRLPTHQAWHNYGGRGITVSPEWMSFEAFWADMGPEYRPGLSIERMDNNGPYSKRNCRWATAREQARNTRRSLPVDLRKAHEQTGVPLSTLRYRWKHGLSMTSSTADPERVSWSLARGGR